MRLDLLRLLTGLTLALAVVSAVWLAAFDNLTPHLLRGVPKLNDWVLPNAPTSAGRAAPSAPAPQRAPGDAASGSPRS